MKYNFLPHNIVKEGNEETIRLTLAKTYDMSSHIDVTWSRKAGEDWAHAHVQGPLYISEGEMHGTMFSSLTKFLREEKIDGNDPAELIAANEKNGGELYAQDHNGRMIRVSDFLKNVGMDEYITNVPGMKKRFQCFAKDSVEAEDHIGRLMLDKAREDKTVYEDIAAWGKGDRAMKKVEKKDGLKMADLNQYCKRGETRPEPKPKLKMKKA